MITLIFENEWYYDVISRYKKKKQTTTTDKQSVETTTLSRMSRYRSEQKLRTRDVNFNLKHVTSFHPIKFILAHQATNENRGAKIND